MSLNPQGKTVLLVNGADRQTLPLARGFRALGCSVATLNCSRLDLGYASRYPTQRILDPSITDETKRLQAVMRIVREGRYDFIVPTSDDTAELLSLNKQELERYCRVGVVEPELFYMAYNKQKTMQVCMEHGIPCPKTYASVQSPAELPLAQMQFPVVVKPCSSFGSIGFRRVDTAEALRALLMQLKSNLPDYVIQEYIPQTDLQYEAAMFVDEKGEIKTALVFSKNRWYPVDGGSSTMNETVQRPDIVQTCTRLLKQIGWRGAADIDLIMDPRDGMAKVMEINPRVSGSVKILFEAGVDIARQMLELAFHEPVTPQLSYQSGRRLRCMHTDLLWLLQSKERFSARPSWFDFTRTADQIFSIRDPWPWFTFSVQAVKKYRREMKKRER